MLCFIFLVLVFEVYVSVSTFILTMLNHLDFIAIITKITISTVISAIVITVLLLLLSSRIIVIIDIVIAVITTHYCC